MGYWIFTVATGIAAWERPVNGRNGGRFTPKRVLDSENWIGYAARARGVPKLGEARIGIEVYLAEGTKGDVDNRLKTVMDALQRCDLIKNDNQIDVAMVSRTLPPGSSPSVAIYTIENGSTPVLPEERPTASRGSRPKTESPSLVLESG